MSGVQKQSFSRRIERVVRGHETTDGGGFRLTRVFSSELAHRMDPFLMLDAFNNDDPEDYIAGFPNHPHRGFETVTYMLEGQTRHRDSAGNEGLIKSGGAQWMSAGRGIVHSEFPEQKDGRLAGFQLWINLAAVDKMSAPWYRDIESSEIPEFYTIEGVRGRVLAGRTHGVEGTMLREKTEPLFVDLEFASASQFIQALPIHHTAFVYVYSGQLAIAGKTFKAPAMALLENNQNCDCVVIDADSNAKALLIAGQPLNEPIVQHGPFVMNTTSQLLQAVQDYQAGLFS